MPANDPNTIEDDDEIFIGPVTEKELQRRKRVLNRLQKNNRQTCIFHPSRRFQDEEESDLDSDLISSDQTTDHPTLNQLGKFQYL